MEKKIKLTPEQKEIVKLMRKGYEFEDIGTFDYHLYKNNKHYCYVLNSTVKALRKKKIFNIADKLTELGKTLPLEPDTSNSRIVTKRNKGVTTLNK